MISPSQIDRLLLANRSKSSIESMVRSIETEGLDFQEFFKYIEDVPNNRKWHFTWLLTHLIESNPEVNTADQKLLFEYLKKTSIKGVKRDLWRSLTFIDINEAISGEVFNLGLNVIRSQNESIAARAHAMLVLTNIAKPYNELCDELLMVFKSLKNDESAGVRSRVKNLSKRLERLN